MGWGAKESVSNYSLINTVSVLGAGVGAIMGGKFVQKGRRRTLIIFNVIVIFSCVPMCILNFYCLMFGKLLFGFAAGVLSVAAPKMLDETVPIYKLKTFGLCSNMYLNLGITIAMIMGLWLPNDDNPDAMKKTKLWRYIYGMPAVFSFL